MLAHYRGYRIAEVPVNHRPRTHGRSRYGVERYLRGFFDLLSVSFLGRYGHRPLHLFGGLGPLLGSVRDGHLDLPDGSEKPLGHAIGQRPLLILGVLLVVVGIQLFSLGLLERDDHQPPRGARRRARADSSSGSRRSCSSPLHPPRVLYFGTYERTSIRETPR